MLKSIDFQESSKIVTLVTPSNGKVSVMVRGARKPRSKFAGFFEAGNVLDVVYYFKPSRSVQNLTEVSYRQKNWNLRQDYAKLAIVIATMEMVEQLVHDSEDSSGYFNFCEKMIGWINDSADVMPAIFPYIQLRLAEISGIAISLEAAELHPSDPLFLQIEHGIVSRDAGTGLSFRLTPAQGSYLVKAISQRNSAVFRNQIPKSELKLLIHHLDVYFKHHIEGLRDRRSDAIFEQIL